MASGHLRNLMLMLAAACLVSWSCTRDEQLVRPDDAPGVPEPSEPQAKSGVFFSENNPTRVLADDDGRADIVLAIGRENPLGARECTVAVRSSSGVRHEASFGVNAAETTVSFTITKSEVFSLEAESLSAERTLRWSVELLRAEEASERFGGVYLTVDGLACDVEVEVRRSGDVCHYSYKSDVVEGGFSFDGTTLVPDGGALAAVASRYLDSDGIFALSYADGRVEYLLVDRGSGVERPSLWEFVDGWLTPVVSWEASPPLDPVKHPWDVWVQRYESGYRIFDLYRGKSHLSLINTASPASMVRFSIDSEGNVDFPRQASGFVCDGIFSYPFEIAGTGRVAADGDEIEIPFPLHSTSSGAMAAWTSPVPVRLKRH